MIMTIIQKFSLGTWALSHLQDIDDFSLRKRVLDELRFLGTKEVPHALYGQPLDPWTERGPW